MPSREGAGTTAGFVNRVANGGFRRASLKVVNQFAFGHSSYSYRSATMGSTRVARAAGM
jgi:hypothetical protein